MYLTKGFVTLLSGRIKHVNQTLEFTDRRYLGFAGKHKKTNSQ